MFETNRLIGPIVDQYVIYQEMSRVYVTDARTGELIWTRQLSSGSRYLLADNSILTTVARNSNGEVEMYSLEDGALIGTRSPILGEKSLAVFAGRGRVSTGETIAADGSVRLRLWRQNFGEERALWEHSFDEKAKVSYASLGYMAVVEPSGKTTILHVESGRIVARASGKAVPEPAAVYFFPCGDHFAVITDGSKTREDGYRWGRVNGTAIGIDRFSGDLLWSTEVEGRELAFDSHGLMMNGIPIVVFSSQEKPLEIVDTRNGKVLFETDEKLSRFLRPRVVAAVDTEKHIIRIECAGRVVTLDYGEPIAGANANEKAVNDDDKQ